MSDQIILSIFTGVVIGFMVSVPLWMIVAMLRLLLRITAKSKLSLNDYLELEHGYTPPVRTSTQTPKGNT